MIKAPKIEKSKIETVFDNKYLKFYKMDCGNGLMYYQASRRDKDNLIALKADEDYEKLLPDAVTCVLVIKTPGEEPRLYMEHEFRYPTAHFLLSPPAGLIDPSDAQSGEDPRILAAKREIKEETGVEVKATDEIKVVSPLFFSTPGMTDESNAIVCATVELPDLSSLTNDGAEGSECIDGYSLLTKDEAKAILKKCTDEQGHYFSVFTWCILMYFVYEM